MAPNQRLHETQLEADLSKNLASVLRQNVGMSTADAMRKVTRDMLANNPFVPPTGCPINDLPNELLSYIFFLGTQMELEDEGESEDEDDGYEDYIHEDGDSEWSDLGDNIAQVSKKPIFGKIELAGNDDDDDAEDDEEDDDDGEEEEEDIELQFQVLVSHVCRHWREVAIESPALWTTLNFLEAPPFERSQTWIQRSKGLPLDIYIDSTLPDEQDPDENPDLDETDMDDVEKANVDAGEMDEGSSKFLSKDEFNTILDIITPHVAQWRTLEVTVSLYSYMHLLLSHLSKCPSAPLLQALRLYHYEDCEEYETFAPAELSTPFLLFHGIAPNLRDIALWGVHLAWDESLSFLNGLIEVELAYHAKDVRPSFETFSKMLLLSPNIRTLTLCLSGPSGSPEDWGNELIELPSLQELVLCYHEAKYIESFMPYLSTPNVHSLALDYDDHDYTDFAKQLVKPIPGKSKSLLAGLENLKISGLPCDNKTVDMIFEQLTNLQSLNLNCSGEEEVFFDRLMKPSSTSGSTSLESGPKVYCPNLETITTTGIDGAKMRTFVEARRAAGVPLKKVVMSEDDIVEDRDEKWLRGHLDDLEFFEPSDSEEELVMEDDDDEMMENGP